MDHEQYWEQYYARSVARRGSLRTEDCYCESQELFSFLAARGYLPRAGSKALVVGSGTSDLPSCLAAAGESGKDRSGSALTVTAIDVSASATHWMKPSHPDVTWLVADAASMDVAWTSAFSLLVDKGLLGSILAGEASASKSTTRCATILSEYRRVLQPGAWAIVVMPDTSSWLRASVGAVPAEVLGLRVHTTTLSSWSELREEALGCCVVYALRAPGDHSNDGDGDLFSAGCPSWVQGVEDLRDAHGLLVICVTLGTVERRRLELDVSEAGFRVSDPIRPFDSLQIPTAVPPSKARWTRRGLELSFT